MRLALATMMTLTLSGCLGAIDTTCGDGCPARQTCQQGVCVCDDDTVDVNGDPSDGCEHQCAPGAVEGELVGQAADLTAMAVAPGLVAWLDDGVPTVSFGGGVSVLSDQDQFKHISVGVRSDGRAVVSAWIRAGEGVRGENHLWALGEGVETGVFTLSERSFAHPPGQRGRATIFTSDAEPWRTVLAVPYRSAGRHYIDLFDLDGAAPEPLGSLSLGLNLDFDFAPALTVAEDLLFVFAIGGNDNHAVTVGAFDGPASASPVATVSIDGVAESHGAVDGGYLVNRVDDVPNILVGQEDGLVFVDGDQGLAAVEVLPARFPLGGGGVFKVRGQPVALTSLTGADDTGALIEGMFAGDVQAIAVSDHEEWVSDVESVPVWAGWWDRSGNIRLAQLPCR